MIGIVLGTLLTIHFRPSRWLIRLYIEVFRGLPIIVTLFLVFYGLPPISPAFQFSALTATSIALVLWGSAQVAEASRRGRSTRSPSSSTRRPPRWASLGRPAPLRDPAAGAPPPAAAPRQPARQHHPEHDAGCSARRPRVLSAAQRQNERVAAVPPIGTGQIHALEIFLGLAALFFVISFPLTRLAAYLERRLI